jgi:hypothetical protein
MKYLVDDKYLFHLAHREFFEPLDRYVADETDFVAFVGRILPSTWKVDRRNIWFSCNPPSKALPLQGWKIHLSGTPANASAILSTVARLLAPLSVPFKFAVDKNILFLLNGKRWARGGAGKFITIYPSDTEQCRELLEFLYVATIGYSGPYILSDRRYRDSSIVHYRYGGLLPVHRLDITGEQVLVMETPDGKMVDDERRPYFELPSGLLADPFSNDDKPSPDDEEGTLKGGRYVLEGVVSFSNSGGVYLGLDRETGNKVLIKEARPFTSISPRGTDAVWLLKKEHRLLTLLEDTGIAPRPLDFFRDWEHYYLVEEFLEGRILRGFIAQNALNLRTRASLADATEFVDRYCALFQKIGALVCALHERRIVFSDLSHYNVMVLDNGQQVRLIDFEGAYEQGVDLPTFLYTPGFVSMQALSEGISLPEDDYYAFGGLMMAGLIPMNSLLVIDPQAHERFLRAVVRDLGVPSAITLCVKQLMHEERSARLTVSGTIEVLRRSHAAGSPEAGCAEVDEIDPNMALEQTLAFIDAVADLERQDRLFPADPTVFQTNPLSIAHGACGVAYVMQRVRGGIQPEVLKWILSQKVSREAYPPGLYIGLSGIAWTLLELGLREEAEKAIRLTYDHHLLWRSPDLFYGVAGWGMTQLRFFLATGDDNYLAAAEQAGDFLKQTRVEDDGRAWWQAQGDICCGLAHGASGISLFLLYLYLATAKEEYLQLGRYGLEFVFSSALRNADGGMTWRAKERQPTYTPYWRWGTSGVGIALLRYREVLADDRCERILHELLIDTDRKFTIFPSRFFGLAGIGEFHLDRAMLGTETERAEALKVARKALAGILLFRIARSSGLAFPGETLTRISCDYGTGGAGIALFVHRFLTGGKPAFMLDELLKRRPTSVSSTETATLADRHNNSDAAIAGQEGNSPAKLN